MTKYLLRLLLILILIWSNFLSTRTNVFLVLVEFGGVSAGKAAMALHDINAGDPRLPLRSLTADEKITVEQRMRAAGFMNTK